MQPTDDFELWPLALRLLTIPAPVPPPLIELYRELSEARAAYADAIVAVTQIDNAHARRAISSSLALVPSVLRGRADELHAECDSLEQHATREIRAHWPGGFR